MYKVYLTTMDHQRGESHASDLLRILKDPIYHNLEIHVYDHPGGLLPVLLDIESAIRESLQAGKKLKVVFVSSACSCAAALYVYCYKLSNTKLGRRLSIELEADSYGCFTLCFHTPAVRVRGIDIAKFQNSSLAFPSKTEALVFYSNLNEQDVNILRKQSESTEFNIKQLFKGRGYKIFTSRFKYALTNLNFSHSVPLSNIMSTYENNGDVLLIFK
ncbi:TPA: hypothetical protein ACP5TP_004740 [Vibrio parahaemolyticus]